MRYGLFQTFAVPLLLLAVTIAGLVLGLVVRGWLDLVAVIALVVPLLVLFRAIGRRNPTR